MEDRIESKVSLMERLAEGITIRLNKQLNKEGLELQKMKLGLEIILINISKFIVIFSLAIYFNLLKEIAIMLCSFGCTRRVSFGLHAKSSMACTVLSLMSFILGAYFSYYIKINDFMVFIGFVFINFLLFKYAPADTENHPLLGQALRKKLKRQSVFTGGFLMIIALILPSTVVKTLILLGTSFQVISILPITYKILHRGYNNYEKYEREIIQDK